MGVRNKVCIMTGGGSGIGRSAALMMAQQGAKLALAGRTASKVEAVRDEIVAAGGEAIAFGLDVSDIDGVRDMVKQTLEAYGRIDILVNNAGHSSQHRRILTTPPEEIRAVIDSNLVGMMYCTQAVLPTMLEAGEGTVLNVASLAGIHTGYLGGMIYSTVKAAVIHFTKFITFELNNTGVRACVLIPGEIDTPIMDNRPIPPSTEDRTTMIGAEECAEAMVMMVGLPKRSTISELQMKPTMMRVASETANFP